MRGLGYVRNFVFAGIAVTLAALKHLGASSRRGVVHRRHRAETRAQAQAQASVSMSSRPTRCDSQGGMVRSAEVAAERAYVLLEDSRLRCERLIADAHGEPDQARLRAMHRQLGAAGWVVSSEFDPARRLTLLARARRRSARPMPYSTAAHGLAEITVEAEDALAEGLTSEGEIEHLHMAHVHLLHAMELLHGHLYPSGAHTSNR